MAMGTELRGSKWVRMRDFFSPDKLLKLYILLSKEGLVGLK